MQHVYIGCGGYSNEDWRKPGLLYERVSPRHYLETYSRHFDLLELNSSFYATPTRARYEQMYTRAPQLRLTLKVSSAFSHKRCFSPEELRHTLEHPQVFRDAGLLCSYLIQFPYSFSRTPANRAYLTQLTESFSGYSVAIEFRHASWDIPAVHASFAARRLHWVSADYPPLEGLPKPRVQATSSLVYIRLHGRNTEHWWTANSAAKRHDYLYSESELREWAGKIAPIAQTGKQILILFQNTTSGHALKNIPILRALLEETGVTVWKPPLSTMEPLF